MSEIAICTRQLAKSFAGREGLRPCSLTVERGTLYALLGENGAGKTTLFKLLLGFLRPQPAPPRCWGWTASGRPPRCCGTPAA